MQFVTHHNCFRSSYLARCTCDTLDAILNTNVSGHAAQNKKSQSVEASKGKQFCEVASIAVTVGCCWWCVGCSGYYM